MINHFWLVVWNICYFSIYWECHHPNWRTHIFQRGRSTTNQINHLIVLGYHHFPTQMDDKNVSPLRNGDFFGEYSPREGRVLGWLLLETVISPASMGIEDYRSDSFIAVGFYYLWFSSVCMLINPEFFRIPYQPGFVFKGWSMVSRTAQSLSGVAGPRQRSQGIDPDHLWLPMYPLVI